MLPKDGSLTLTYKDNQTSAGREKGLASTGAADVQSSAHSVFERADKLDDEEGQDGHDDCGDEDVVCVLSHFSRV